MMIHGKELLNFKTQMSKGSLTSLTRSIDKLISWKILTPLIARSALKTLQRSKRRKGLERIVQPETKSIQQVKAPMNSQTIDLLKLVRIINQKFLISKPTCFTVAGARTLQVTKILTVRTDPVEGEAAQDHPIDQEEM